MILRVIAFAVAGVTVGVLLLFIDADSDFWFYVITAWAVGVMAGILLGSWMQRVEDACKRVSNTTTERDE